MYFTSNHDENSWNGSEFERMGANAQARVRARARRRSGSMPLLYTGQEVSMRKRLRFFEKDTVDWSGPSLAPFYRAVFDLKHRSRRSRTARGAATQTTLRTDGGDRVYAFERARGNERRARRAELRRRAESRAAYHGLRAPGTLHRLVQPRGDRTPGRTERSTIPAHGYRVLVR